MAYSENESDSLRKTYVFHVVCEPASVDPQVGQWHQLWYFLKIEHFAGISHMLVSPRKSRPRSEMLTGKFVISLDFELQWGAQGRLLQHYRANLLGVRQAIPAILSVFSDFKIHATWAAVGFLFFESRDQFLRNLPHRRPEYKDKDLDPYELLDQLGKNETEDPLHFAPSLIRRIRDTEGQEIGTHTFSHYSVFAEGCSHESFRDDIRAALRAGALLNTNIRSIVFPFNQITQDHLRICAEEGLTTYRGLEFDPYVAAGNHPLDRAKRLADSYVNLSGSGCGLPSILEGCELVSVPQSRFLRPYSHALSFMDKLQLQRITKSMTLAAQNGVIFHLWWHPHNFGVNIERNIQFLRSICEHYLLLSRRYGFQSCTMGEVGDAALKRTGARCQELSC